MLENLSIHAHIQKYGIKTESGVPVDFRDHPYMFDVLSDLVSLERDVVAYKGAQIGFSLSAVLAVLFIAKNKKIDIIYTLPTNEDMRQFAGGKTNRIIAQNPIYQEWVKEKDTVEQKTVGDNIVYYRGCIDEETEVLTEKGWCKYQDVSIGDKLPTLNLETTKVEIDNVLDKTVFEANEKMIHIHSRQIDQLVTQDHRCIISKRKYSGDKGDLRVVRAHELIGKRSAHIPMKFGSEDSSVDPLYRIAGWVIGDGSYWTKRDKSTFVRKDGTINNKIYETPRVCIIQIKLADKLESDLKEAGIRYHKKPHNGNCFRYELSAEDSKIIRAILPLKKLTIDLVFKSTQAQRRGLFEGLMMSDGDNYNDSRFYQNKTGTCSAVQALLVFLGRTSALRSETAIKEQVNIRMNDWANPFIDEVDYKGIAWCPTTKNGTIFIRRNGIVSVTGQTFSQKAAMMVSSDLNAYDEVDASNQEVIEGYATRLQHSKLKRQWYFSHPSVPGNGVSKHWDRSDQKHWFITCEHCKKEQYISWPESIDLEREIYVCKACNEEVTDDVRRRGRWVQKYKNRPLSGYWIPLLICPRVSAKEIIGYKETKSEEYFTNKVLGLPYVGGGNKVTEDFIWRNLTDKVNMQDGKIVIGVDTGVDIRYVIGNKESVFYMGECKDYSDLEEFLKRWPTSVMVIDQGGDIIGPRKLREKYPGRVFLCFYQEDKKSMQIIKWGENDEAGRVMVDRNRAMQLVIDELGDKRIALQGTREDWMPLWTHFSHIYRVAEEDAQGRIKYKWLRSDRDDFCHCLLYWRVGMDRFGMGNAEIFGKQISIQAKPGFDSLQGIPAPQHNFDTYADDWRS